jgi:hypothetical protein
MTWRAPSISPYAVVSYRRATAIRSDHPAALQGLAEAAAATGDNAAAAEALTQLLSLPADGVPPEKRLDWTRKLAAALTAEGKW